MSHGQDFLQVTERVQIVVVDEDEDKRILTKEMIESQNYMAHTTSGIVDTLTKLSKMNVAEKFVFLMEYKLSDGYAPELVQELCRRNVNGRYVMLTNGSSDEVYDYVNSNKEDHLFLDYLFKPIALKKLMQVIKRNV